MNVKVEERMLEYRCEDCGLETNIASIMSNHDCEEPKYVAPQDSLAFAQLLRKMAERLETGARSYLLADEVESLGKAMRGNSGHS